MASGVLFDNVTRGFKAPSFSAAVVSMTMCGSAALVDASSR